MLGAPGNVCAGLSAQEPKVKGEQAAQTTTVCAPQQVSIPEGALGRYRQSASC